MLEKFIGVYSADAHLGGQAFFHGERSKAAQKILRTAVKIIAEQIYRVALGDKREVALRCDGGYPAADEFTLTERLCRKNFLSEPLL